MAEVATPSWPRVLSPGCDWLRGSSDSAVLTDDTAPAVLRVTPEDAAVVASAL